MQTTVTLTPGTDNIIKFTDRYVLTNNMVTLGGVGLLFIRE